MRLLLGLLMALALSNCVDENVVPPSMRVIEYGEISGRLGVYVVADSKRDLCFVVFQHYEAVTAVKVDCSSMKPTAEKYPQPPIPPKVSEFWSGSRRHGSCFPPEHGR